MEPSVTSKLQVGHPAASAHSQLFPNNIRPLLKAFEDPNAPAASPVPQSETDGCVISTESTAGRATRENARIAKRTVRTYLTNRAFCRKIET